MAKVENAGGGETVTARLLSVCVGANFASFGSALASRLADGGESAGTSVLSSGRMLRSMELTMGFSLAILPIESLRLAT